MDMLVELKDGGIWIMPVIMLVMAGTVTALVLGLLTALKIRVPAVIWLLVPTAAVMVSTYGLSWGIHEAEVAVMTAPPEMIGTLAAGGASIALLVTVAGALAVIYLGMVTVWTAGIGGLIASLGVPGRVDIGGLLVAFGGPVLLAVAVGVAGVVMADEVASTMTIVVLLGSTVGLMLAAARVPTPGVFDDDDEVDPRMIKKVNRVLGTVLSARAAAWVGLSAALAGGAWFTYLAGTSEAYRAVATATPEMKATLEAAGRQLAMSGTVVAAIALVGSVLLGVGLMAVAGKRAFDGGRLAIGALCLVPALILAGCAVYVASTPDALVAAAEVELVDLDAIVAEVGDPPALAAVGPYTHRELRSTAATFDGEDWQLHEPKRKNPVPDRFERLLLEEDELNQYAFERAMVVLPGTMSARSVVDGDIPSLGGDFFVRIPGPADEPNAQRAVRMRVVVEPTGNDIQSLAFLASDTELYLDQADRWVSSPVAAEHGDLIVAVSPAVTMNGVLTLCSFSEQCDLTLAPLNFVADEVGRPLPGSDTDTPTP